MSRIGKNPVEIPAGVTVTVDGRNVTVKGSKGELAIETRPEIKVTVEDSKVVAEVAIETKDSSAYWGLTRALIANMIVGVTDGFSKTLKLVGVGYRAKKDSDRKISLTLGFSHPVVFDAPEGITLEVPEQDTVIINGIDKQLVGLIAAKIRKLRKPEPYKGKGVRYENEIVRRKPGKAAKIA
jgi:large subunit ribosomal protein L6